jgi:hypothetical protein
VTVIVNAHELARCVASTTVQVTVDVPTRKFLPLSGVQTVVKGPWPDTIVGPLKDTGSALPSGL